MNKLEKAKKAFLKAEASLRSVLNDAGIVGLTGVDANKYTTIFVYCQRKSDLAKFRTKVPKKIGQFTIQARYTGEFRMNSLIKGPA